MKIGIVFNNNVRLTGEYSCLTSGIQFYISVWYRGDFLGEFLSQMLSRFHCKSSRFLSKKTGSGIRICTGNFCQLNRYVSEKKNRIVFSTEHIEVDVCLIIDNHCYLLFLRPSGVWRFENK